MTHTGTGKRLSGVVAPMMTPLTSGGEIDQGGVERLVEFLLAGGVHALFVLGSSGEFVSLPWSKQRRLLELTVEAVRGRVPVCAGISSNCLEEILERGAEAAACGADYAVALPPFYFRASQPELLRFFTTIADHIPIPLILYNMPFRTNNNIEPATVEALAAHPRIAGIKDTVPDMARTLEVLGRVAGCEDFGYFHGNELLALPAILYGARGMVPAIANFEPAGVVQAYETAVRGDLARLRAWQKRIQGWMRVFSLLENRAQESTTLRLQAIKLVLELMGICGSTMAQLSTPPDEAQRERVKEFMRAEGIGPLQ
jgi:dihydrodipicolinate synthase/N-acetylneuraminate lyase